MAEKTVFKEEIKSKFKKPRMYRIILINDDYTTMDFVVEILVVIFNKTASEATKIMIDVHEKGKGVIGLYPYDIAMTKIAQVDEMSKQMEFPLKVVMEEE
jgi:ATP-dependent Clp protease adaptor protein ClpS